MTARPDASWRRALRPASFRGVAFSALAREMETGRRVVEHQFPGRDEPWPEDMGRKRRAWNVEAILFGADYMAARDRLLTALEREGPGEYIDHWGLSHQVQVGAVSVREEDSQGGICRIRMTLTEAGAVSLPTTAADTRASARAAADAARLPVLDEFARTFSVAGGDVAAEDALARIGGLLDGIERAAAMARPANLLSLGLAGTPAARLFAVLRQAARLRNQAALLIHAPGDLGGGLTGLLSSLIGLSPVGRPRYRAARSLATTQPGAVTVNGGMFTTDETANRAALVALTERWALIEAARATTDIAWTDRDAALAVRDDLGLALDAAAATAPDDTHAALMDLRTAAVTDITRRGDERAALTDYTPQAARPALVIAHDLYGDPRRESDILARNPSIRHPGFVAAHRPLKVTHA